MSTLERLRRILADMLGLDEAAILPHTRLPDLFDRQRPEPGPPTGSFVDDIPQDSLDRVELTIGLEEAFDLSIPDSDVDAETGAVDRIFRVGTVQDLSDWIDQRRK